MLRDFRAGVSNRHSAVSTSDFPPLEVGYWLGNTWERPERLCEQSRLRYAAGTHTRLLVVHSEDDLRWPIEQAEQLFTPLTLLKREVLFIRYPAPNDHSLPRGGPPDLRLDRLHRLTGWLDRWFEPQRDLETLGTNETFTVRRERSK